MRRALASDFDGTLFFGQTEERFHAQDIFDIMFFQKTGGLFGICTGRSPDSILDTVRSFIRPDFMIAVSGALTTDGEGNILHECCMDREVVEKIYRMMEDEARIVIHADGNVYSFLEVEYPLQRRIYSFDELPEKIYGISMRLPGVDAARKGAERIRQLYGKEAEPHVNVNHIDVVAAGCSKATGICKVREHYGIDLMGGIGDSFNDLPLIEASDMGFTFADSPRELREAADEIVLSVSDALAKLQAYHP